jgi:excisionase family DNA binding protein
VTQEFLTIDDAAVLLRCSTKSIRRHVHAGNLPALRGPGGRLLFESQSLRQALCPAVGGTASRPTVSQPATAALAAMASDLTTLNA